MLERLEDMLETELEKIEKEGKLTTSSLEIGDKTAHFLKSIKTINAMDEAEGYSYDGYSYARGRGRNARRDSMGRYSSEYPMDGGTMSYNDGNMSYRGGNTRGGGYSRGDSKEHLMREIHEMKRKVEEMED